MVLLNTVRWVPSECPLLPFSGHVYTPDYIDGLTGLKGVRTCKSHDRLTLESDRQVGNIVLSRNLSTVGLRKMFKHFVAR